MPGATRRLSECSGQDKGARPYRPSPFALRASYSFLAVVAFFDTALAFDS